MDQGTLVDALIADGQKVLPRLAQSGVPITAACWMKETDGGAWYLYLVTPLVGRDGATTPAYRKIDAVIRALPERSEVGPGRIKAVGPSEPVGQALLNLQNRHPGKLPSWYDGTRLGDVTIETAYIYAPPVVTAS